MAVSYHYSHHIIKHPSIDNFPHHFSYDSLLMSKVLEQNFSMIALVEAYFDLTLKVIKLG